LPEHRYASAEHVNFHILVGSHASCQEGGLASGERAKVQPLGRRPAFHELHRDKGVAAPFADFKGLTRQTG
jgi:hypothetical protein